MALLSTLSLCVDDDSSSRPSSRARVRVRVCEDALTATCVSRIRRGIMASTIQREAVKGNAKTALDAQLRESRQDALNMFLDALPTTAEMQGKVTRRGTYKVVVAAKILLSVAEGSALVRACTKNGTSFIAFQSWIHRDTTNRIGALLAKAREYAIDARLLQAENVLESMIGCDEKSGPAVNAANNLAHYHKWVAAAHHNALYGPKSSVKQEVSGAVTVTVSQDDDAL